MKCISCTNKRENKNNNKNWRKVLYAQIIAKKKRIKRIIEKSTVILFHFSSIDIQSKEAIKRWKLLYCSIVHSMCIEKKKCCQNISILPSSRLNSPEYNNSINKKKPRPFSAMFRMTFYSYIYFYFYSFSLFYAFKKGDCIIWWPFYLVFVFLLPI